MIIKVNDGVRVWNALVVKKGKGPNPCRLTYLFTSRDVSDRWDEKEYKVYRDNQEGTLLAIPEAIH